jgi:hypothetical protein
MQFSTTNNGYEIPSLHVLYPQLDPNYCYPGYKHPNVNRYRGNPLSAESTDQPSGFGLEQFMCQRKELIDSKIQMVFSEINQRYQLKEENLYQINLDQCSCRTFAYMLGDHVWDRRKIDLERKIIDLEQEKRREKTNFFRDILFLRKELRESMIEKLEEEQKSRLLTSQEEVNA